MKADAADRAFYANLFASIAEEMGVTLGRTAYSPNIKERRDYSCAVFDPKGNMVAQAAHIPVHLGAMPMSVRAALDECGPLQEGDVVILNDPFRGGTHLPDITLVSAVPGCALLATRAHHADVGGMTPGSLPPSTDIHQEGLRIPPIKLVDAGTVNQPVFDLILANVRTPQEREGDLRAQIAAHETGTTRVKEAAERYGAKTLLIQMEDLLKYGRTLMQSVLHAIPNGTYSFEDTLNQAGTICATLTVRGRKVKVDFAGTSPSAHSSLNAVEAITRSAVYYCFLCLLATPSRLHRGVLLADPPLNAGCFDPIEVLAPAGTLVNAEWPSAVAGGNVETSQRIVDVVMGALAKALPDIIPAASQGTMNNLTLGGIDPTTGIPFAYYETVGGGMGPRPNRDGIDAVQVHMTNTLNTPIEALELAYPFRIESYSIRPGSGGKGQHRGGHGIVRDLRVLCRATGALLTSRRDTSPYGLAGGQSGTTGVNALIRSGRTQKLPSTCKLELRANDVIRLKTPGGGGHG